MLVRERPFQNRTPVPFVPGTKSTGYEGYNRQGVRVWVRGTTIFKSTEYGGYGVRWVPCSKGTKKGTGYGNFSEYRVRRVRGTKGTVLRGYGKGTGYSNFSENRVRRVRGTKSTASHGYEIGTGYDEFLEYSVRRVRGT